MGTAIPQEAVTGGLFAPDFLSSALAELPQWQALDDNAVDAFVAKAKRLVEAFAGAGAGAENESQTENELIWPILAELGWTASLRQQNMSARGRENVPDGLLFASERAKAGALEVREESARYAIGTALVESKRWRRPLDRASGLQGEALAPSSQMLRYLRRADDLTNGAVRWGILTNGAEWRLYYQGAQSVADQFFGIDLAAALDLPGSDDGGARLNAEERRHAVRLFLLFFHLRAFTEYDVEQRTLHQRALRESRYFEQRIADDLSQVVFESVFPELAQAMAHAAPDADMDEVRDAVLVLLYRLLFILYAEDRNLLPVQEEAYADVGLRQKVRQRIRRNAERGLAVSSTASTYYHALQDLCRVIDRGDPAFGLPPYNGGLFQEQRAPLLNRILLTDDVMARVVDALSFAEWPEGRRHYVNYRGLSVQHLGSIYERLLEHELQRGANGAVAVRPNTFARKTSGSYYTPDELVRLVLAEAVTPLVEQRLAAFRSAVGEGPQGPPGEAETLAALDPATAILQLAICDPAMGSGHFLVNLVDLLSDHVIAALAEADEVPGYRSPLAEQVAAVRRTIEDNAAAEGWNVALAQLDDRQIVRRMVLKRCVYGVDKNPMAVELAKLSLWLHTFTVGAPLSFLDHHLRCGDSLFGCWIDRAMAKAEEQGGSLFIREPLRKALAAADPMQRLEALADAEIAEAEQSAALFREVDDRTAPLARFLSVLHAFDWLNPTRQDAAAVGAWLGGAFGDPVAVASGDVEVAGVDADRFLPLLAEARALAERECFLHWQAAFPGVWKDWEDADFAEDGGRSGGFDAVIGNPPWDRMKMQQVEWFAARRPAIAKAQRAADRRRMIRELNAAGDPLGAEFRVADGRAAAALRVVRGGGEYPLLGRGDINLYTLFVERAMTLVKPDGVVGLLTPSGIASDQTASRFFQSVSTQGRLRAFYDFENRRTRFNLPPFFADVDSRFKFSVFVASRAPFAAPAQCAFFLQDVAELEERRFVLTPDDFRAVNPNTRTAPVFRTRRDARITTAIYRRMPVLANHSAPQPNALAAEVPAHVRHDERFRLVPHPQGTRRTGGRLANRRERVRQPERPVAAALRGQDGAGVRPPGGGRARESGQSAPARAGGRRHGRAARRPKPFADAAVLGAGVQVRLAGGRHLALGLQGNHCADQRPHLHRRAAAGGWIRQQGADLGALATNAAAPGMAARRKLQRHDLRLRDQAEGARANPQPVHRRAASGGAADALRRGALRRQDRRRGRPRRRAGTHLHGRRHGAVRRGVGACGRERRREAALPLGRGAPAASARQARCRLLPPLRRHRPRRRRLHLLHLPHRRTTRRSGLGQLPLPRP